jgi:hypothetical protein
MSGLPRARSIGVGSELGLRRGTRSSGSSATRERHSINAEG